MRRALAVIGAIVLIALGFAVRSWRAGDPLPGRTTPTEEVGGTIVCVTELSRFCADLASANPGLVVITEEAGVTYRTVTAADFDAERSQIDLWLAPAPWATMAAEARQRNGAPDVLGESTTPARSPLVIVIWQDRLASLQARCGSEAGWKCIGDVAGKPWAEVDGAPGVRAGDVRPGIQSVDSSATGLLVAGQASAAYFGRTDFASQDFDDPGFRIWADQLASAAQSAGSDRVALDQMLSFGPATFDLAGTTEAAAALPVTTGRDKDRLRILYPSPAATADLAVTPVASSTRAERLSELLTGSAAASLLTANGWRVDDQPLPTGARSDLELPTTNGLPRPGVLDALRTRW